MATVPEAPAAGYKPPLRLDVSVRDGGMPLGLTSYLLRAVGTAYPGTMLDTRGSVGGPTLSMLIPHAEIYAQAVTDGDLACLLTEADLEEVTAFTTGWRNGAVGLRFPMWLSTLLRTTAEQMVQAMPPTAENYVALDIVSPDGGEPFVWIVCRPGRPSPHELRQAAEQRAADLFDECTRLKVENARLRDQLAGRPECTE